MSESIGVFHSIERFDRVTLHIDWKTNLKCGNCEYYVSDIKIGNFLISHGQTSDVPHRLSELSADGRRVLRSYGDEERGNELGRLSWPAHVCGNFRSRDWERRVILADCDNDRVYVVALSAAASQTPHQQQQQHDQAVASDGGQIGLQQTGPSVSGTIGLERLVLTKQVITLSPIG